MMRRLTFVSLAVSIALAWSLGTTAFATGGAPRVTTMSGSEEAPGPGDADGTGFAAITLNVGQEMVCWELSVADITLPASAAHIHRAPVGVPGGVVVPLSAPDASGQAHGCRMANPALIQEIIDFPERFYVNVHNSNFPAGAVRGQLSNRGQSE